MFVSHMFFDFLFLRPTRRFRLPNQVSELPFLHRDFEDLGRFLELFRAILFDRDDWQGSDAFAKPKRQDRKRAGKRERKRGQLEPGMIDQKAG